MPVEDPVEIARDDRLLPDLAGKGLRDSSRLDDLLDLPHVAVRVGAGCLRRQQPCADELLRDRRRATLIRATRVVRDGRQDGRGIVPVVVPEAPVLRGRRGIEDEPGDLVEGDDPAVLLGEAPELDLAGPVVDDGRLRVAEREERRGIGQVLGQCRDDGRHGSRGHHQPGPGRDEHRDQQGSEDVARAHALTVAPAGDRQAVHAARGAGQRIRTRSERTGLPGVARQGGIELHRAHGATRSITEASPPGASACSRVTAARGVRAR